MGVDSSLKDGLDGSALLLERAVEDSSLTCRSKEVSASCLRLLRG